ICPLSGPADPAAKLIELGETEALSSLDEDGIDVGYVETRLDDGRADKNIVLVGGKVDHDSGELLLFHLAVAYHPPCPRHQPGNPLSMLIDRPDPVVKEVHLAASF